MLRREFLKVAGVAMVPAGAVAEATVPPVIAPRGEVVRAFRRNGDRAWKETAWADLRSGDDVLVIASDKDGIFALDVLTVGPGGVGFDENGVPEIYPAANIRLLKDAVGHLDSRRGKKKELGWENQ